ncbi:MAG: PAS domain-containing protein [Betaproteobacteria bacterium]|nr:PAS domain-containing protein [Betaproteobacteria bacterium]
MNWFYSGLASFILLSLLAGGLLLQRANRRQHAACEALRESEVRWKSTGLTGLTELTELKLAAQEIRYERDLFAGGPVTVFIWLPHTGWPVAYVSRNIIDLTGYSAEELTTGSFQFSGLIHPDDIDRIEREVAEYLASGARQFEQSYRLRCKSGEYRWFHDFSMPERDQAGAVVRVRAYMFDQTEIKQTEAALIRSNTDLEQFAYSISHDMRQPLRMISSHLQLLERAQQDTLDEDSRANLNFALDGARRMDQMIVSLLDYSRIGRKVESNRWLNSRQPLDEALTFLAPAIQEADARIAVDGEWPAIFASQDEMTRLLQNLLGNAVKYHAPGQPPRIEVASAITLGRWRVSVADHGIGIAPKQIDRLFHFFSRLQPRNLYEGSGMGLALCRRIVENYRGRIWAESAGEGLGSRFIFEIPLQPPARGAVGNGQQTPAGTT